QCHERLSARVDAKTLPAERQITTASHVILGHELTQPRLTDAERKARITTRNRVTDPVAFILVEKQHLVGLGDRILTADVTDVCASIGKHEVGRSSTFLCALVSAFATTDHVAKADGGGLDEKLY